MRLRTEITAVPALETCAAPFGAAVLVGTADRKRGNHWILRYDWVDVVDAAERTSAEILEAYTARTTLILRSS